MRDVVKKTIVAREGENRDVSAMHNTSDGRQQQRWTEDERWCWPHRVPTIVEWGVKRRGERME